MVRGEEACTIAQGRFTDRPSVLSSPTSGPALRVRSPRMLAPSIVDTVAVLSARLQAYWQPPALFRERPFAPLSIWARSIWWRPRWRWRSWTQGR